MPEIFNDCTNSFAKEAFQFVCKIPILEKAKDHIRNRQDSIVRGSTAISGRYCPISSDADEHR